MTNNSITVYNPGKRPAGSIGNVVLTERIGGKFSYEFGHCGQESGFHNDIRHTSIGDYRIVSTNGEFARCEKAGS